MRWYAIAIATLLLGAVLLSGCYGTGDPKTDYARQRGRLVDVLNHHLVGNSIQGQARNCTKEVLISVKLEATLYGASGGPWGIRRGEVFFIGPEEVFDFIIWLPELFGAEVHHCKVKVTEVIR